MVYTRWKLNVKARKEHRCSSRDCGKIIKKGDEYSVDYANRVESGDYVCLCKECDENLVFCSSVQAIKKLARLAS